MERTVVQCRALDLMSNVTVVTWPEVWSQMQSWRTSLPNFVTLCAPGNSSLKGASGYLELRPQLPADGDDDRRTVVLLGDVVYSWACLQAIFLLSETWG